MSALDDLIRHYNAGGGSEFYVWLPASAVRGLFAAHDREQQRIGAVKALREFADAHRMPWTIFLRADGSPVTVGDLMRESADRIENGEDS